MLYKFKITKAISRLQAIISKKETDIKARVLKSENRHKIQEGNLF